MSKSTTGNFTSLAAERFGTGAFLITRRTGETGVAFCFDREDYFPEFEETVWVTDKGITLSTEEAAAKIEWCERIQVPLRERLRSRFATHFLYRDDDEQYAVVNNVDWKKTSFTTYDEAVCECNRLNSIEQEKARSIVVGDKGWMNKAYDMSETIATFPDIEMRYFVLREFLRLEPGLHQLVKRSGEVTLAIKTSSIYDRRRWVSPDGEFYFNSEQMDGVEHYRTLVNNIHSGTSNGSRYKVSAWW